ncbi:hypothetical protein ZIOFF_059337 [Zingiber officinale]|uniref:Uncharacterized protein n=1 Tax=Zingiber officinale TaxID=94328 RepID=A0A8J5KBB3_ZINOF|nr:hypothetical protein ZIOFF_059337 [Zingiber officinale]
MGEWELDEMPLPALFEEASKIRLMDVLRKGILALRRCDEMISKLGLFSSNETKEDVARFNRQRAAEAKLQEIKEKKERRHRSLRAAALSSPVEVGEDDVLDDDGEEEREPAVPITCATFAQDVLRAGHRLPIMSKEEAGLCEMEMMKKWHEKNVRIAEEANSSWHKDITAPTDVDDDTEIKKGKSMGRLER